MSSSCHRILYYAPRRARFDAFLEELRGTPGLSFDEGDPPRARYSNLELEWTVACDPNRAMHALQREYVHLLLIDMRCTSVRTFERCRNEGLALLTRLDDVDDVEARYGFHRIVALVSGPDPDRVDRLMVELGARGVRTVLRERTDCEQPGPELSARALDKAIELIRHRQRGKRALCAAGGGITGIYFELGALKCLDDCLSPGALNRFDMYFGISAGAIVTSLLANGYSLDEIMAAIAGVPGGRVRPLDFRLLRLGHFNASNLLRHIRSGLGGAARQVWGAVRDRELPSLNGLMIGLAEVVPPPFHTNELERVLRELFERPGATNDFRMLPRRLFIGATDQDARQHVLFGSEGWKDIPISRAVQASSAINPAFTSVEIDGRYYEDGAVTRTANFSEAIRRSATLVVVVDPFLPYVSKEPGMAHGRGFLYNIDQNIRTVSYTRFENARNSIMRRHPEVSSYTFLPSNTLRRVLSLSPMDHRPYMEIWRGAYLSTLKRIHYLRHRMRGDVIAHGMKLDTARADAVAVRLRAHPRPELRDFFPDGRVEIVTPPLVVPEARRRPEAVRYSAG